MKAKGERNENSVCTWWCKKSNEEGDVIDSIQDPLL